MKNSLIWIYDNALSSDFCKKVISKFESDDKKAAGVAGYQVRREIKRSTDISFSSFDDWKEYDKVFCDSINEAIPRYYDYVDSLIEESPKLTKLNPDENTLPLSQTIASGDLYDTGYQIQRTDPGDFYDWHNDAMFEYNSITAKEAQVRVITFIWYLNDIVHDGYTQFLNGERVQPKEGRLVLFPATWDMFHRGYPPKCETKYICTGWLYYKLAKGKDLWSSVNNT